MSAADSGSTLLTQESTSEDLLQADSLTTYEITRGGTHFRLNLRVSNGSAASVELPFEMLRVLMMTLPRIQQKALGQLSGNAALRVAYPLADWGLERSGDNALLLTVATDNGFQVCFKVDPPDAREMADALAQGAVASRLN